MDFIKVIVFLLIAGFVLYSKFNEAGQESDTAFDDSDDAFSEITNAIEQAQDDQSYTSNTTSGSGTSSAKSDETETVETFDSDDFSRPEGIESESSSDIPSAEPVSSSDTSSSTESRGIESTYSHSHPDRDRAATDEEKMAGSIDEQSSFSSGDTISKLRGELLGDTQTSTIQKAVLWKEILDKPVALRSDHLNSTNDEEDGGILND